MVKNLRFDYRVQSGGLEATPPSTPCWKIYILQCILGSYPIQNDIPNNITNIFVKKTPQRYSSWSWCGGKLLESSKPILDDCHSLNISSSNLKRFVNIYMYLSCCCIKVWIFFIWSYYNLNIPSGNMAGDNKLWNKTRYFYIQHFAFECWATC